MPELASIVEGVSQELASAAMESLAVLGALHASPVVEASPALVPR